MVAWTCCDCLAIHTDHTELRFDVQADENGKAVAVAVKPVLGRKPIAQLGSES